MTTRKNNDIEIDNKTFKRGNSVAGCPLFFNIDFPWLFHDQKNENPWPITTTYIHVFPSKWYTTYECIPEL